MVYIVLLSSLFTPLIASSFVERLSERFILGSTMLNAIKQECAKRKDEQSYDILRKQLAAEQVPFYIKFADLFSESKGARIATLWRESGALLNEFLFTLIPFTAAGAAAVWRDPDVYARLRVLYAPDAVTAFTLWMGHLERIEHDIHTKLEQSQHWWWPTMNYSAFKDEDNRLKELVEAALKELLDLRLMIQAIAPIYATSPFKYLVPAILKATEQLQHKLLRLKDIDIPSAQWRYKEARTSALNQALLRCIPHIKPMVAR